jgi:hypothetical protein
VYVAVDLNLAQGAVKGAAASAPVDTDATAMDKYTVHRRR